MAEEGKKAKKGHGAKGPRQEFSADEAKRIVTEGLEGKATKDRDAALIRMGMETGFRASELLSMKVGDVWRHDKLRASVTVSKVRMKGKKNSRTVPLRDTLTPFLQPICQNQGENEWLFRSSFKDKEGMYPVLSYRQALRVVKGAAERVGVLEDVSGTHSLRKTFAMRIYHQTHDVYRTKEALGHTAISSTERYLRLNEKNTVQTIRDLPNL